MAMTGIKTVSVDATERVCLNCIYYEQYAKQVRSDLTEWMATHKGHCLLKHRERMALRKPCAEYIKD